MDEFRFEDIVGKLSIYFENYTLREMGSPSKSLLFCHLGIQDHICLNLKYLISSHNPLQVIQGSHPCQQKLNIVAYTFKIYCQEMFSII